MFTHIDATDPERQFAFGVFVDDDDMYAGTNEALPLLATHTASGV